MPTQTQRRRRTGYQESDDSAPRRQARRDDDSDEADDYDEDEEGDVSMTGSSNEEQQMIKRLVRYAMACEHARISIRRDGIRDKVLGNNARSFKRVFDGAQKQLRDVFGMEMVELPMREKRTLKEKQKATARKAASQGAASSRQYILISILPREYRTQSIVGPSRIPSTREEAEYIGFCTFVISVIALSGGELSDIKMKRHLNRMNAGTNLPMDKTENVLAKMARQGYVEKVVEKSDQGDEDTVTWCIGPRGKVEVPPQSIASVVREVWGVGEIPDDLEKKIRKSLSLQDSQEVQTQDDNAEQ